MGKVRAIIVLLLLSVEMSLVTAATFRVNAPKQVIQGQKFTITYQLDNASEVSAEPTVANPANCRLIFGPAVSQSSSYQNINGRETSSSSIGYTYTYLAQKAGTVTVGSAKINVSGKTFSTRPFSIQILPPDRSASSGRQNQSVQVYDIDSQTTDKPVGDDDVFVRIVLSKPTAYEQEGVICSIKLYSKYQISRFVTNVQPAYNGFMAQDVPIQLQGKFETVGGDNYYSYVVKQSVLFPQQVGKLTISSGSYDLTVVQFETINTTFGRMRSPVEKTVKINSNSAVLNVVELPQPRPADFTGAVGDFRVTRKLEGGKVRTNEASTIKLTISGDGNLKSLTAPKFGFPRQFELYDPQTQVTAEPSGSTLRGKVEVDYTFIPQSVGRFVVEGTSFSYFNPATKQYVHVDVPGFNLNVEKGSASGAVRFNAAPMKDILPMFKGDLGVERTRNVIIGSVFNWLFYVVLIVAFVAILIIYRKRLRERANVVLMKRKGANKVAGRRLKRARKYMQKKQEEPFYEEMLTALWGYFSDKLSIPVSELNRDNISKELADYGVREEVIANIISIIDECELSRYAKPSESGVPMKELYGKACESIGAVENAKRK